jgi:hypothetical protein
MYFKLSNKSYLKCISSSRKAHFKKGRMQWEVFILYEQCLLARP